MPETTSAVLLIDPVSTRSVSEATRAIADRHEIVRVRRPRESLRHLDRRLALFLARWDPACVESAELFLSARAAREHDPQLPIVFFVPGGVQVPSRLAETATFLVAASLLEALLPVFLEREEAAIRPGCETREQRPEDRRALRHRLVEQALAATEGNVAAAARTLSVSRRTIYRRKK